MTLRFGEQTKGEQPLVVLRKGAEVVGGELVEQAAGLIEATTVDEHREQHATQRSIAGVSGESAAQVVLELEQSILLAAEDELREQVGDARVPGLRLAAHGEGLLDQCLGIVETSVRLR